MKKLSYLVKSESNLKLIKSYFYNSINLRLIKKSRKQYIEQYKKFLNQKKISYDFFSRNSFDWIEVLKKFKEKKFEYLEIGSFEGNSALFILENFKNSSVTCVDPWKQLQSVDGSNEGYEHLSIINIEKNFDQNLIPYYGKFIKKKMSSGLFFKKNEEQFDVIYIDGSHFAEEVIKDCRNSWLVLKKNGILILDDYFWKGYRKLEENPAFAINKFLKEINNNYKIIRFTKFQLFLTKLN